MPPLNNKTIVLLTDGLELGGAERQLLHLARYLKDHERARVQIWGFSRPGRLAALCEECHIPWKINRNPHEGSRLQRLARMMSLIAALREAGPDILLPYTSVPNIACGLIWRWTPARLCIWNQRDAGLKRLPSAYEKKAARRMSFFIANSQPGADFLKRTFHVPPHKMKIIRNGAALPAPEKSRLEWRTHLGADENTFLACMVANLSRYKDHETLLKAWRQVAGSLAGAGRACTLLLAGRFDGMEVALKALAFDLDLGGCVRFLGGVDDIAGLLGAVDLGVFSSRSEGCPNGVLECMAAGLAVAATDISGIRGIVSPENAAYLSAVEDSDGLARSIDALARDPALRRELGEKNRRHAVSQFSMQHMCRETAALLEQLAG